MNQRADYPHRQGAYDLRKLRGKGLAVNPGHTRRYHIPPEAARTIATLLTLRDQVIAPILAGVRSSAADSNPPTGPASTATTRPSHRHGGTLPRPWDHAIPAAAA